MSKDTDAWMPLYIGDWDTSTRHLDVAEDGAYGRMVRHYWKNGPLPDVDAMLARIVGVALPRWLRMRPTLAGFFLIDNGLWTHKRVERELEQARKAHAKAVERARAGGIAKAAKERASSTPKARFENAQSQLPSVGRASKKALPHRGREAPLSPLEGEAALTPEQLRERIEAENVVLMARRNGSA